MTEGRSLLDVHFQRKMLAAVRTDLEKISLDIGRQVKELPVS